MGRLDDTDRRILQAIARDARLSARAIAREVGVAPGTVSERLERLEQDGIVTGYHAAVDPASIGRSMEFLIGLQTTQGHPLAETLDQLMALPPVFDAYLVTGQWDVVVHVRVGSQEELEHLLIDEIWTWPNFRHSETMMVLNHPSRGPAWVAETEEWGA